MDKLILVVPSFHTITRSFTKKINISNYVKGHDYESEDFFASHNEQIPIEEATPEKIKEVSDRLFSTARLEVETVINERINELRKLAGLTIQPNAEELKQIVDIIAALEAAATETDVEKARQLIRNRTLNQTQLDYLVAAGIKANARVLGTKKK